MYVNMLKSADYSKVFANIVFVTKKFDNWTKTILS